MVCYCTLRTVADLFAHIIRHRMRDENYVLRDENYVLEILWCTFEVVKYAESSLFNKSGFLRYSQVELQCGV
jgi:hypothetical protein